MAAGRGWCLRAPRGVARGSFRSPLDRRGLAGRGSCSAGTGAPSPGTPSASAGGLQPGAVLVGSWKVRGAGEDPQTWARFTATGFEVLRHGYVISGEWTTGDDRLVASVTGFDGRVGDPAVPWLTRAVSFTRDGDDVQLRAASGEVLATLTPDPSPPEGKRVAEFAQVPTLAPGEVPALNAPTPAATVGPALVPADLLGRWVTGTATDDETRPFVDLRADGTYRSSDGCNGAAGAWQLLAGNRVLTTPALSSLTACNNLVPVQDWIGAARSASVIDGRLTLFDDSGAPLGSFDRG